MKNKSKLELDIIDYILILLSVKTTIKMTTKVMEETKDKYLKEETTKRVNDLTKLLEKLER